MNRQKEYLSQVIAWKGMMSSWISIGSDQWIYSPEGRFIIEIYHEGETVLYRK